jgi:hypothetical protein
MHRPAYDIRAAVSSRSIIPINPWPAGASFMAMSATDKDRIAHGNAEKLFKL